MKSLISTVVALSTASLLAAAAPSAALPSDAGHTPGVAQPQPAAAASGDASSQHGATVSHPAATSGEAEADVGEFWTPARMKRATSLDTTKYGVTVPQSATATREHTFRGGRWTKGGRVRRTTGKVFFQNGGSLYECSASVVSGVSSDIVVTAGHCVYDQGRWASKWAFVPAFRDGNRPFGTWAARKLFTTQRWIDGKLNFDVGFARLNHHRGRSVADVVGAQGIIFNRHRGLFVRAFGYPAVRPYNGRHLVYCRGRAHPDRYSRRSTAQGIPCNMTPGASGGPWLIHFDPERGRGLVNSINSYIYEGGRQMYGPYFGRVIQRLYASIQPRADDGSYLRVRETGNIFRIHDGRLVRIKSWRSVGGVKRHCDVTAIYLDRYR